jgi:murein DD-endopeptidase MepM/ murein hydrolase activator NlpD
MPALAALLIAQVLFASPAQAAPALPQSQVDEQQKKIQDLEQQIAELQKQLNATTQQKQTLQSAINTLNLNIEKLQKSISLTQTQISQKNAEIKKLTGNISDTASSIGKSQSEIAGTLRQLEIRDNESIVASLLTGASLSSFFDEATSLAALRQELENRVQDLSSLKTNLETSKSASEKKRAELLSLQSQLNNQKEGLTLAKASQQTLLKDTQNKEANYQSLIAQKQAEKAAFEAALFNLSSGLGYASNLSIPPAGTPVLHWPLDAVFITQLFGATVDAKRLYTSGTHDGVDFRASIGTPVRAALSGTVLAINQGAVKYCQYGKWVLIQHPNGLATLYAHLSEIRVGKGESVATGEVIGFSGDTGYATGPHLHLSVYAASTLSFKQYTCKSGYTVTIPIAPLNGYLDPLSYLPRL